MGTIYFDIRDAETGEVLGQANTYNGGGGSGLISKWETEVKNWPHDTGHQESRLTYWDYDYEPDEWASEVAGRPAQLVATVEVDDYGHVTQRFDADGFDKDGRDWQGYDHDGYNEDGHEKWDEYYWDTDENGNAIRVYAEDEYAEDDYDDGSSVTVSTFDGQESVELKTPQQISEMSDAELQDYKNRMRGFADNMDLFSTDEAADQVWGSYNQAVTEDLHRQGRLPESYAPRYEESLKTGRYASEKAPYDDNRPRDEDGYDWDGFDRKGFNDEGVDRHGNHKDDGRDPLADQEPLWSSDNGFSGGSEPSGPIASSENGFGGPWKGIGNTFSSFFRSAKSSIDDMPKTGDISVSSYDYVRNGKRVHVKAHKRKRS